MKSFAHVAILGSAMMFSTAAFPQPNQDAGKLEFDMSCSICHGNDAKGSGMVAAGLKVQPSDLTLLSKKNSGVFPLSRITAYIDGRSDVLLHGTRDMPVWGARYSTLAGEKFFDVPYDHEKYVSDRIRILTNYISSVQEK